mmetsp:Transcript_121773/g.355831  ORF Transcript_121773/g.355831 Transcript_121773/m.355831 type:complete len:310 (-) Transcript_121773:91-1020(-)
MGNASLQNKGCCCSSNDDINAVMDMVNPQQLSQGAFKDPKSHSAAGLDPEAEEEVEVALAREKQGSPSKEDPLRKQLLMTVRQDDAPGVLQYIADGADIVDMGEALRLAAHRGAASVVRELVAVGISVNEGCPHTGFTPLQLSAASGHVVVCELLLDALADVHRPVGGATALSLARKMGNAEVEEVIERHVASLLQQDGEGAEDGAQYRRAHVLPRVSPLLSEAVLQALPAPPGSREAQKAAPAEEEPPQEEPAEPAEPVVAAEAAELGESGERRCEDASASGDANALDLVGLDCDSKDAQSANRVRPL